MMKKDVESSSDSGFSALLEGSDYPDSARRIMTSALELFARKGYAATSVRAIVDAADVTNPMLYYYFDDKEGLFLELISYLFELMTERVRRVTGRDQSLEEEVAGVVRSHMESCLEAPVTLQFVYVVLFGPEESTPDFDLFEAREPMVCTIRSIFERAVESGEIETSEEWTPDEMAEQLLGVINVHLMRALKEAEALEEPEQRLEHMRRKLGGSSQTRLVQFFLRGLEPR